MKSRMSWEKRGTFRENSWEAAAEGKFHGRVWRGGRLKSRDWDGVQEIGRFAGAKLL